ncbi:hypothetical protein T09_7521 [Trichinella sp. T9]|nr:hypothetical protein T09_7521 [Trichinella sp. T9]
MVYSNLEYMITSYTGILKFKLMFHDLQKKMAVRKCIPQSYILVSKLQTHMLKVLFKFKQ